MRRPAIALLALALAACSRTPLEDAGRPAAASQLATTPIRLDDAFAATLWKRDPYAIQRATVEGDVLTLVVTHGGGCATHDFSLVASTAFMESLPVQVAAVLTHDARGDACKALIADTLRYDLTPLRDAYRRAYGTTSGTVVVRLWGRDEGVRYDF